MHKALRPPSPEAWGPFPRGPWSLLPSWWAGVQSVVSKCTWQSHASPTRLCGLAAFSSHRKASGHLCQRTGEFGHHLSNQDRLLAHEDTIATNLSGCPTLRPGRPLSSLGGHAQSCLLGLRKGACKSRGSSAGALNGCRAKRLVPCERGSPAGQGQESN